MKDINYFLFTEKLTLSCMSVHSNGEKKFFLLKSKVPRLVIRRMRKRVADIGGERGKERKEKKRRKKREGGREEGKICKFLLFFFFFFKVLCGILESNADNSYPHNK